ncbi:hypothetical protein OG762_46150 [Streptomyces sp. NBC_01136]|uniref:dTMP kinase n=1 Tax=Streptomyces sp. NBC_01136 TaxID=2903754 RepID=UPI003865FED0|nr:hypothetical protein OG762_00475 [Streptomyces sp. NBC_01136]WST81169.1 hypothetical protein OG762_46150 [Streptomyces sp. NBC_01136]
MTQDATAPGTPQRPPSTEPGATPPFFVLLGPDYAGKSSVLAELADRETAWRIVSADDEFLEPGHSLIARLRRDLVGDVLRGLHRDYSPDFMVTVLQTAVLHLRDSIERSAGKAPVLVDSYYYKILAKCRLTGIDEHPMFDWWRTFPQPRRVIFLDVSAETAWRRCGSGSQANPLEYYGDQPQQAFFASFQSDLRKVMREEVRHLPVTVIKERDRVTRTAQEIREVIARELG